MKYQRLFPLVILFLFFLAGCKKDCPDDCNELKTALSTDNKENVQTIITRYINNLPNREYTEQNINSLAASLSGQCALSTEVFCFDCIMTLPGQTEIQLKFTDNQLSITRTIDISYTADNMMKFVSMHE